MFLYILHVTHSWDELLQLAFTHLELVHRGHTDYLAIIMTIKSRQSRYKDLAEKASAYHDAATTILASCGSNISCVLLMKEGKDRISHFSRLYWHLDYLTWDLTQHITSQQARWLEYSRIFHQLFSPTEGRRSLEILKCNERIEKINISYYQLRRFIQNKDISFQTRFNKHKDWMLKSPQGMKAVKSTQ